MAPSAPRDDEQAPDTEDVDALATDEAEDLDGLSVGDGELSFEDREPDDGFDDAPLAEVEPDADADDDEDPAEPLLADDEQLANVVAAIDEDEEDPGDEDTLREGEFVCRSCFMAKRDSALADEDALLCRDCVA